jgi:translation initiation factor 4E
MAAPIDLTEDHPLNRKWGVWRDPAAPPKPPRRGKRNPDHPRPPTLVGGFDTIMTMWRQVDPLPEPGAIAVNDNVYIFQGGVAPRWEDSANANGGRWLCSFSAENAPLARDVWRWVYLGLFGETFDPEAKVTGIVLSGRRCYTRISVWVAGGCRDTDITAIGAELRKALPKTISLEFQDHGAAFETPRFKL